MVTRALPLVAAFLIVAAAAWAFPVQNGNTASKCKKGITFDTLTASNNARRSVYLINCPVGGVRGNPDSVASLWFNGGATPAFRRIQHFIVWNADPAGVTQYVFDLTIFRDGASSRNKLALWPYEYIDIPLEADSIQITSRSAGGIVLGLGYW